MSHPSHTNLVIQKLYKELADSGWNIDNTWFFTNVKSGTYNEVLPILVKYIPLIDDTNAKDGLIRSVSIKGYKDAVSILLSEYKKTHLSSLMWSIGNALRIIKDKTIVVELIELLEKKTIYNDLPLKVSFEVKNPEVIAKENLLPALGATKDLRALPVLREYIKKPEFAVFALEGLKFFKNRKELLPDLLKDAELLLDNPMPFVQKAAARFIKFLKEVHSNH